MNPVQIQKYIQYCMGFGYLDKRRYADDLAQYRSESRVMQARLDQLMKAVQEMSLNPPPQPAVITTRSPVQTFFLRMVQVVVLPFQWVGQMAASLGQMVANLGKGVVSLAGSLMEQTVGRLASFFFGHKKDKTEEKENRDKEDFKETDLFTKMTTHATSGGAQGAKR